MKSPRGLVWVFSVLCLIAAATAAALYFSNRREVTTSSAAAYRAYREAIENEQRFYVKDARAGFARALELDPDFAMAMLGLARTSERDQAKSLTERARQQRAHLTERERLHLDMQYVLINGKVDEGVRVARTIHAKYPDDTRAAMVLAGEEMNKGNPERAVAIFQEIVATDPNNAAAYNTLGYYYGYRGDYDKAIENFKKYQFLAPDQANPYDSMGEIQANSGRYEEAIANLNRALAIKPDFYQAFDHLGVAYEGEGDTARAIQSYERAAQETISERERAGYLGKALRVAFLAKDRSAAEQIAAKLKALPKNETTEVSNLYTEAARDLLESRPAEAEQLLRESKPKVESILARLEHGSNYKPYDPAWNLLMGMALEAQGKTGEAIPLYELVANPPNPWTEFEGRRWVFVGRARLAALLAKRGEVDRAEKLLAENRKWNPSWAPTRAAEETVARARQQKVTSVTR